MDLTAFTLAQENNVPILVYDMGTKGNLKRLVMGEPIGTIISND
jgi:uridylate kinase